MIRLCIFLIAPLLFADLNKTIYLRDYWNVERNNDFVSGGVPLPKGMIEDASHLSVLDGLGNPVPFQSRPLMRWPDSTLRWIYLFFPANAQAQAETRYGLKLSQTGGLTPPAFAQGEVRVTETSDSLTVSTGAITFVVRKTGKGFNLFHRVLIARDNDNLVNDEIISPSLENGALIRDRFDSTYTSGNDLAYKAKVEEKGPLYVILKIEGNHSNGSTDPRFYGYQCRITAFAGQSFVNVQYSVKNSYFTARGALAMNAMSVRLKGNLGSAEQVTLYGDSLVPAAPLADSAYVYQWRQNGFWAGNGVETVDSGSRALGWIDISDANWGIAMGDYEFASNCPNELAVRAGGWVEGRFFPARYAQGSVADSIAYKQSDRFFIGLAEHKTHRFCLYFHKGSAASAGVERVMAAFNHPLRPVMDREWVALTRAIPGDICPAENPVIEPATTRLPPVNAPLQSAPYTASGTGINGQYYDSWCSFGEAFWRNETGDSEIWENQGTRYLRWLSPYTHRLLEANAWLYADFRGCHIDSAVGFYGANNYYGKWWNNTTRDPVHSAGLPNRHRWIAPTLGTCTEHFSNRDLFTYYLVSGDLKIRDALYEFAQLSNRDMTWFSYAGPTPGLGGMARHEASSWSTLLMAGFVENTTDTVNGKTLQQYFREIMFDWANGRPGKVGIFQTMTPIGAWNWGLMMHGTDSLFGTAGFFEALVDMPFVWYLQNYWNDTLQPYLERNAGAWRDTIIGAQGAIAYQGTASDTGTASSASFWRIPGIISLLARQAQDTVLFSQLKKHVTANRGAMFNSSIDQNYYSPYDITCSQAYLLQERYPDLFWVETPVTWDQDPTGTEGPGTSTEERPALVLSPNPFNPAVTIRLTHAGITGRNPVMKVFDLKGRLVAEIKGGRDGSFVWDGRDNGRRAAAAGVYAVRVEIAGKTLSAKGLLIK